jgi:hypothetical protein
MRLYALDSFSAFADTASDTAFIQGTDQTNILNVANPTLDQNTNIYSGLNVTPAVPMPSVNNVPPQPSASTSNTLLDQMSGIFANIGASAAQTAATAVTQRLTGAKVSVAGAKSTVAPAKSSVSPALLIGGGAAVLLVLFMVMKK